MRILFMGSGPLACPCADAVLAGEKDEVAAVVTQPDRPKGRQLALLPSPVKTHVAGRGVSVLTPDNVNDPGVLRQLEGLKPDLIVVVAYGQLLKPALLAIPPKGCVNVHASLLPKYRGAAPIQWAIARGETITGVTTMHMNERMDAGDIIHQETVSIESDDTAASLQEKLGAVGAALLRRTIADIRSGTAPRTPQDDAAATLAPKLRKSDGRIAWHMAASEICCRVRGFNPWPGSACEVPAGSGRLLRVLKAREEAGVGQPGEIIAVEDGPLVGAARNAVRLLEVQPEGRKPMSGAAFLRGHPLTPGTRLG